MLALSTIDSIKWFTEHIVNPINEGPIWIAVFIICLMFGWVLKAIPSFPNQAIPAFIILIGGALNIFGEGEEPQGMHHRQWAIRNFAIGMCVGFAAWFGRKYIWKAVVAKFKALFPGVDKALEDSDTAPPFADKSTPKTDPVPPSTETKTDK